MSIRISIVCEDHTLDQYVVKPVLQAMLNDLGKPKAEIRLVTNPKLGGISQLKKEFDSILKRYSLISDLVVFIIDGDGDRGRKAMFEGMLDSHANAEFGAVVIAQQEVEVWALRGARRDLGVSWSDVRKEPHPKERFFDALTTSADAQQPGRGRARLIRESLAGGWRSFVAGIPELKALQVTIAEKLGL